MILAPRQPIPHGRLYRCHPNGPVHMVTARKRVGPLPVQQLAVRYSFDYSSLEYFSLDDSTRDSLSYSSSEASSDFHSDASSDSSSRHSLSDHSSLDLLSTSAGPSCKRRRSLMTYVPALPPVSGALSPVRADLIPLPKRVRDSDYLADVEVGPRETSLRDDVIPRGSDKPHLEQDIDPEIETGMRGPVKVRVERVMHPAMPEDTPEPTQEKAIEVTYETLGDFVQRFHDHTQAILVHRVQVKRDNRRLRGTASVESQRVDRLQRGLSRMQREINRKEAKEVPGWSPEFEEQLDEDSVPEDDIFGGVDKPNMNNSEEEFKDENVVPDTMFDNGSVKPSVVKNSSGNQGLNKKAKKDWVKELCVSNKVNFLSLQETKMDVIDLFDIKSVCPLKINGKKMLWEYLMHVMASWKGDVITMGDFNEVRYSNERIGSNFNVKGANAFNSFIILAGLEEIPLGGCSFTWCHKSGSKMSKLDRFLVSESLLKVDGFEKLIVETWSDIAACGSNDMLNLMYKLKNLKKKIRGWNSMRQSFKNSKIMLKSKLAFVGLVIDKRNASEEVIYKRLEIVNSINELEKQQAMEMAQKAKIKWAIEGDEYSKYYHGILNKKGTI
uniref:RNA-directed DNA polymerase, eukaryota n=1 Tax=Tanacetum cinerariifolium TaxID=118510 RepID=A0A699GVV2_TANCI|nr:hypothetical protein [Tanacetum cinerariifolium]